MPSQQRFGCHDACDLSQNSSPQLLGFGCETAAVVVIQAESSTAKLFAKNSILFTKIVDRLLLLLIHRSSDRFRTNRNGSKARSIFSKYCHGRKRPPGSLPYVSFKFFGQYAVALAQWAAADVR
jgi:hypothetical protein